MATVLLTFSLVFQGSRGLWEPDEGRYTNIALRMLQTGDFVVPAFNDDVPHFAKPPFTYWAIAGGISLLGWNEWGARLPNALAFAATIMVVYALARRIVPDRAWLPSLIYSSFLFPFSASNIVTTDTLLTLWESVAVLGFVEWWHCREKPGRSLPLYIMWAGFGLAFLTKGPPGLLPLFAIVAFVILTDGWRTIPGLISFGGIVLFITVGFGWYLFVAITHPGLLIYFINDEFVNRIATGMHHRNPQWYKPFAIYIPVLIFGTLPWTLSLLRPFYSNPGTLFSCQWWRNKLSNDQWPVFIILWVSLPLAIFFMSSSRLPLYILPLFIPLALAAGRLTRFPYNKNIALYLLVVWFVILPALKLTASFYPYAKDSRDMARAIQENIHPIPEEIVFVDSEPFWGLNLYLHSEVEHISTQNASPAEEPLSEELVEWEPGTLFIIDERRKDSLAASCMDLGFAVHQIGSHGSWIFMTPVKQ